MLHHLVDTHCRPVEVKSGDVSFIVNLPERSGHVDSVRWSMFWGVHSDEILVKKVLAVRHDSNHQANLAWLELGPWIEDPILKERYVANHSIGVSLGIGLTVEVENQNYHSNVGLATLWNSDPTLFNEEMNFPE